MSKKTTNWGTENPPLFKSNVKTGQKKYCLNFFSELWKLTRGFQQLGKDYQENSWSNNQSNNSELGDINAPYLVLSLLLNSAVALKITAHIPGASGSRTISFCKELALFELLGYGRTNRSFYLCNLTQNCVPARAGTQAVFVEIFTGECFSCC